MTTLFEQRYAHATENTITGSSVVPHYEMPSDCVIGFVAVTIAERIPIQGNAASEES